MVSESGSVRFMKIKTWTFLLIALSLTLHGCMSSWNVTDEEAVTLLKDYYSFYEEKGVDAEIVSRGEFSQDCECYPIEFHISHADRDRFNKTFYFYKNTDGTAGIKKFKFDMKYNS